MDAIRMMVLWHYLWDLHLNTSTEGHTLPSLISCLANSPAEDVDTSQVRSDCAHRANRKKVSWRLYSWNVRSFLYVEGLVETAWQGTDTTSWIMDSRLGDSWASTDTRWMWLHYRKPSDFGMLWIGDRVILPTRRPVPWESGHRGEGVAVVLTGLAIAA